MNRRTLLMVGVGLASFVLLLALLQMSTAAKDEPDPETSSFSYSDIGHHAFAELLAKLDYPVVRSRFETGSRAEWDAILVAAEPDLATSRRRHELESMLNNCSSALVVLPKWAASWEESDKYVLRPPRVLSRVLDILNLEGSVVRLPMGTVPSWTENALQSEPDLICPQLIIHSDLEPLVSCAKGVLLGRTWFGSAEVLVLSDPDVIANHGLARGDNALFALQALRQLRSDITPVFFDEITHGYRSRPSLIGALTSFPLVLVLLQVLALVGLLLWCAAFRFGRPRPAPPPLEAGKRGLVDNIAALHIYAGHRRAVLDRYLGSALREVAETFDTAFDDAGRPDLEPLEELSRSRGCQLSPTRLAREVNAITGRGRSTPTAETAGVVAAANRIYRWKKEIIHGSRAAS